MSLHSWRWKVDTGSMWRSWVWEVTDKQGRVLASNDKSTWTRFGAYRQSSRAIGKLR